MTFKQKAITGFGIFAGIVLITLLIWMPYNAKQKAKLTNVVTTHTLTSEEVFNFVAYTNWVTTTKAILADPVYALPSEKWVFGEFADAFKNFLFVFRNQKYTVEANDCDDFARAAGFFASYLHSGTPNRLSGTGIAFGEFWYVTDIGQAHAINFAIVVDEEVLKTTNDFKKALKLIFFEPQSSMRKILSTNEMQHSTYWRI
jgi:hypothetical protein